MQTRLNRAMNAATYGMVVCTFGALGIQGVLTSAWLIQFDESRYLAVGIFLGAAVLSAIGWRALRALLDEMSAPFV